MPPKTGAKAGAKKVRRKEKKNVAHGHAHIKSTFNNTIVSITDMQGRLNITNLAEGGQVQADTANGVDDRYAWPRVSTLGSNE